jgi:hypothetical protein
MAQGVRQPADRRDRNERESMLHKTKNASCFYQAAQREADLLNVYGVDSCNGWEFTSLLLLSAFGAAIARLALCQLC